MPGKLFISYRRDDARADARGLHDGLQRAFGKTNVFMDVDNLLPGQRFEDELDNALGQCDVLLAVIGPKWLNLLKERVKSGQRDHVRDEIAAALSRKIVVIPVLIDGTQLPPPGELPEDIRELVSYQKHEISHEKFGRDVDELIAAIRIVGRSAKKPDQKSNLVAGLAAVSAIGLLVVAGGLYFSGVLNEGRDGAAKTASNQASPPKVSADISNRRPDQEASDKSGKAGGVGKAGDVEASLSEPAPKTNKKSKSRDANAFRDCADVCPEMIIVPAGSFIIGDNNGDDEEKPAYEVTFKKPFAMGKYEVTWDEWEACVEAGGCKKLVKPKTRNAGDDKAWGRRPVVNVEHKQAEKYAKWLSGKTGKKYRLPSEAEWEYAARAGAHTRYSWGVKVGSGAANCHGCGSPWDNKSSAPVGSFQANAFGLHDMHGNVSEWVADCWHKDHSSARRDGGALKEGCWISFSHVVRGGSWRDVPKYIRASYRFPNSFDYEREYLGFRVAMTLD
ncbi:MAG: SUMF1/EgtB/PvdO family nonheme iron enzyme [Alphaproteobacteria bacterium]|nr:SUMF1/EgtB/PvdO family nonheme iron enzyme [Alphaproteobacteria bacterium]